ncbi:MAG: hypothetical protein ABJ275_06960 [Maricaulaceae bacterium]
MRGLIGLRGVLALMGRAPMLNFQTYFGENTSAFKSSLAAVGGSVLLIMLSARSVFMLQGRVAVADGDNIDRTVFQELPLFNIGMTALFYLLTFTLTAFLLAVVFHKKEAFGRWATLRHWMVFYALIPTALILILADSGLLPVILATGVLFTVFVGLLFADIRLAFKAGTLDFVGAIFAACIVHAAGLLIIFIATVQSLP